MRGCLYAATNSQSWQMAPVLTQSLNSWLMQSSSTAAVARLARTSASSFHAAPSRPLMCCMPSQHKTPDSSTVWNKHLQVVARVSLGFIFQIPPTRFSEHKESVCRHADLGRHAVKDHHNTMAQAESSACMEPCAKAPIHLPLACSVQTRSAAHCRQGLTHVCRQQQEPRHYHAH